MAKFFGWLGKKLPAFCFQSEKLDTIIWNDKKGKCLEIDILGHFIGYFGYSE